jgi:hypothetical protein
MAWAGGNLEHGVHSPGETDTPPDGAEAEIEAVKADTKGRELPVVGGGEFTEPGAWLRVVWAVEHRRMPRGLYYGEWVMLVLSRGPELMLRFMVSIWGPEGLTHRNDVGAKLYLHRTVHGEESRAVV